MLISTVVNQFLKERIDVYTIDDVRCPAAFDKVNTCELLGELLDKDVPFEVLKHF